MAEQNITDMLEKDKCYCVNEQAQNPHTNLFTFGMDNSKSLVSDCDEQLLLHLEFRQAVKLTALQFNTQADDSAPKTIKIYLNRPRMGFDNVEDIAPIHVIQLVEGVEAQKVVLPVVKFTGVQSLTLFIEDNQSEGGNDHTVLKGIHLFGSPVLSVNANDIHKKGG